MTFLDGPAKGIALLLRSAPGYLLVVRDRNNPSHGGWDALDQEGDAPKPTESVYAYYRVGDAGSLHLKASPTGRGRSRKSASGTFAVAKYAIFEHQPTDAEMRSPDLFRTWTENLFTKE